MYKLVKFTDWYIDSIYIQSFCVMTEDGYDEFDKLLAKAQKIVEEKDVRIRLPYADGHFVYHDVPELCESLEIRDITEQQANEIENLFGVEYGWFPWEPLLNWLDWFEEEAGEEE